MQELLHKLNNAQQQVVTTTEGPVLVLAGAGSGKTRCVIYRTAWLIHEKRIPANEILIVTFTNKAATELKERLYSTFQINSARLWVGTFHSICNRILRTESAFLPFPSHFVIYDTEDQKALVRKICKQQQLDPKLYPANRILGLISRFKSNLQTPEEVENTGKPSEKVVIKIYEQYQLQLVLAHAMDFDDLLMYTAKLLEEHPEIRAKYQELFRYIMIDEYQDTNYAQFSIVRQLAIGHRNICVVGDDDQAIYGWRGASIRNILYFEEDYAPVTTIRLEENYRSTQPILDLANQVISINSHRHEKKLFTMQPGGEKPKALIAENDLEEARQIVEVIKDRVRGSHIAYKDIAILVRTNAQTRVFETILPQSGIPYTIVGGFNFYQRKEIKDFLSYLRVLLNTFDSESMLRAITEPPKGIGATSINKLLDYALEESISVWDALKQATQITGLQRNIAKKMEAFSEQLVRWKTFSEQLNAVECIKAVLKELQWLELYGESADPQDIARAENLRQFVAAAGEYTDNYRREQSEEPYLAQYLPVISLQSDLDQLSQEKDTVNILTMHNAKGLEFNIVFIAGLEQGLLPHQMSLQSQETIEEERRLFYVGITRARKELFLSYARYRRLYDVPMETIASQFLMEVKDGLILATEDKMVSLLRPNRPMKRTMGHILESEKSYRIGQKVVHEEYGIGIVLSVAGKGKSAVVTVSFSQGQLKKIMGQYLQLMED